jgi:hypothetical protein
VTKQISVFPAKHQIGGKTENEKLGGLSKIETSQMEKRMKHRNEKLNKISIDENIGFLIT